MKHYQDLTYHHGKLFTLGKSILVGLLAGTVVIAYRWTLSVAEQTSFYLFSQVKSHLYLLPAAVVGLGLLALFTGTLVARFSLISGSGIPQVKGIIMGYLQQNWLTTLLAKFFGGAAAILSGFALGREGPSIQLGACVGEGIGGKLAGSATEKKILIASGASAGLAAAFNAPLAGALFALEEIFKYFSPVILLSTMLAAVAADFVSTIIFGFTPVFHFPVHRAIPQSGYWLLVILGVVLGGAGAVYNYVLVTVQKRFKQCRRLNAKTRLLVPALLALLFSFGFPWVLGSGQRVLPELYLGNELGFLLLLLVLKFLFSVICFGSGAPGGIFFPMLVLGATIGAVFGHVAVNYLGFDPDLFNNFVIIAMAGFFTAVVRAPITGIILLVEMTGSFANLLSLTLVSVVAYAVADGLRSAPIYETLLENLIKEKVPAADREAGGEKITFAVVVQHGASIAGKRLKEIDLPQHCLLVAVERGEREIIPRGETQILAGDMLILMTDARQETAVREALAGLTTCRRL